MSHHPSYELFEELGRGEHTVVFRGYDLSLGREVAIKQLDKSCRQDPRRMDQFLREAQFLAQFEHDNILRVYSVEPQQGWIIMELMKGTLATLIAAGPSDADLVRSVLRQTLEALEFLHQKNKIHGTVRPTNLLINDQGRVKLSDFERTDVSGELRVPAGSKKYLAPELIKPQFGPFGPQLDLYCLGFTALELLTGPQFDSLFPGTGQGAIDADMAWLRWHSSDQPLAPVGELVRGVPHDLARVLNWLLMRNVDQRPQSARDVLKELAEGPIVLVPVAEVQSPVENELQPAVPTSVREIAPLSKSTMSDAQARPDKQSNSGGAPSVVKKVPARSSRPFSRDWFNQQLAKPYVLYPLCTLILVVAVAIGIMPGGKPAAPKQPAVAADSEPQVPLPPKPVQQQPPLIGVRFDVQPPSTDVHVYDGDQELQPDEQHLYQLVAGKHQLSFQAENYEPQTAEFDISSNSNVFSVTLDPVVQYVDLTIHVDPPQAELEIDGSLLQGKDGVVVSRQVKNETMSLTAKADGYEDLSASYTAEQLAALDYQLKIQLTKSLPPLPDALVATEGSPLDAQLRWPLRARLKRLESDAPLELVLVRPGEYVIGAPSDDRFAWELAARTVRIDEPFYVAVNETTNAQYNAFYMDQGADVAGTGWLAPAKQYAQQGNLPPTENDLPVVNVSHQQAELFCRWVGGRLPIEEQWECAVRGPQGQGYPHPWGAGSVSERRCRIFRGGRPSPVPVDQLADGASSSGLLNTLGNVAEWCSDRYESPEGHKKGGASIAQTYVIKGCSFATARVDHVRVTWRQAAEAAGQWDLGFRIVVPVPLQVSRLQMNQSTSHQPQNLVASKTFRP